MNANVSDTAILSNCFQRVLLNGNGRLQPMATVTPPRRSPNIRYVRFTWTAAGWTAQKQPNRARLGRRPSRAFCRAPASRMSERLLVGIRPKALSSITSSPKPTLTPQHGQTPWTPYAELQAEACHTVACSRLLCTAQTELELGDVCRIQPALGHRSSDTNPLPCYPSLCSAVQRSKTWRAP